jgi:uncharacterized membrane protein
LLITSALEMSALFFFDCWLTKPEGLLPMKLILALATASVFALGWQAKPAKKAANPKKTALVTFASIQPIFNMNCLGCHSGPRARGGIDLSTYKSVMEGGEDGPIVKKFAPKHSLLVQALRGSPGVRQMPPRSGPLADDKIAQIEKWIGGGAKP